MERWFYFFQSEVGAAATLAGLLFVSVSVNQTRLLSLGRMADRGAEALCMLLLALVAASLPLVPGQPPRLLGGEIASASAVTLLAAYQFQRLYACDLQPPYRRRVIVAAGINWLAILLVTAAGLLLLLRGDDTGLYLLVAGILLIFAAVGVSAWVLLVEINR